MQNYSSVYFVMFRDSRFEGKRLCTIDSKLSLC